MFLNKEARDAWRRLQHVIDNATELPPCQVTDPELWFSAKGDAESANIAKKFCRTCPAVRECAIFGIANQEEFGIFGGLSPRERGEIIYGKRRTLPRKYSPSSWTDSPVASEPLDDHVQMEGEKTCRICGEVKNVNEFTIKRDQPDGRRQYCRPCYEVTYRKK